MQGEIRLIQGQEAIHLLEQFCARRIELEFVLDRSLPPVKTTIRNLDLDYGYLEVFAFDEEWADQQIQSGKQLFVRALWNEMPYFFQPQVAQAGKGVRVHLLRIPSEIKMLQRRKYFRMKPPRPEALIVQACYNPQTPYFHEVPQVHDLSLGGIGILDEPYFRGAANTGALVQNQSVGLKLLFEDELTLELEAIVRYLRQWEAHPAIKLIGLQFQGLTHNHEAQLQRIVSDWQRQTCRVKKLVHE